MDKLTHISDDGKMIMVDISSKAETNRMALATGSVSMAASTLSAAVNRDAKKGDPVSVAELAGIMAAKKTSDLIPLCHPLPLSSIKVNIEAENETTLRVIARAKTTGKTGVEMEALTAASIACLTLYDMLKAIDKEMVIGDIKLLEKTGGKSGPFVREQE